MKESAKLIHDSCSSQRQRALCAGGLYIQRSAVERVSLFGVRGVELVDRGLLLAALLQGFLESARGGFS